MNHGAGFVYFIQASQGGPVKIGTSRSPERRLARLQESSGFDLALLTVVPGNRSLESKIHRELSAWRLRGEWFAACESVEACRARLAAEHGSEQSLQVVLEEDGQPGSRDAARIALRAAREVPISKEEFREWTDRLFRVAAARVASKERRKPEKRRSFGGPPSDLRCCRRCGDGFKPGREYFQHFVTCSTVAS